MAKNEIDEEVMKKAMADGDSSEVEEFVMDDEEMEEAKKSGFNPFWSTKNMEEDTVYKFRIVSDKIIIRDVDDNFAGEPTPRMVIAIKELETDMIYDLAAHKEKNEKTGNYSSLTLAMRKLYALTGGDIKDKIISLTKRTYKHEKYGETSAFTINIINPGDEN